MEQTAQDKWPLLYMEMADALEYLLRECGKVRPSTVYRSFNFWDHPALECRRIDRVAGKEIQDRCSGSDSQ